MNSTRIHLASNHKVIVSNTSVSTHHVMNYISMAASLTKKSIIIKCIGTFTDIHNVPKDTLDKMRRSFEDIPNQYIYDIQQNILYRGHDV